MKRKRDELSDDDDLQIVPKSKKRRKNKYILSTASEEKYILSTSKSEKNKKQTNLSSFFKNIPTPSTSLSTSTSDASSGSEIDDSWDDDEYFYNNTPKWNCNQIRTKIRKLLETPGFKITHWLKELDINSNSYQRYMKLKGKWNNTSNQTYEAAYRYFKKQEKLGKKKKAKDKTKSAKQRKLEAANKKMEKQKKEKEMKAILNGIKSVEDNGYDSDNKEIYDDCNDVRKNILLFLKRGIMTKSRFLKEIGNVAHNSYSSFASMGPLKLSGASNQTYYKAYHWLEKLRIYEGVKKTKKRLKNEQEYPNGFPLRHDNGMRLCFRGQRPVIRGDRIVFM